jgi:hypothetical protein
MATQAQILSWDFQGNVPAEHQDGMLNRGIHLSNNSWTYIVQQAALNNCASYGDYDGSARDFDRIAVGAIGGRMLPVVFSAGNERDDGDCGMTGGPAFNNYAVVSPPSTAKNVITVGAINSNNATITGFSSWGPVDDRRLKPEVVAGGCATAGDTGVTSTRVLAFPWVNDDYDQLCGTSMAAPAVSGVVALLMQQYQATLPFLGSMPSPATIKALLTHTATDLGRPGLDYVFGYGLINAQRAADIIAGWNIEHGNIISNGQVDTTWLTIVSGMPELKFTLAWDDPPAAANAARTLVNDLDLRLVDPSGQVHRPFVLNPTAPANNAGLGVDQVNVVEQVLVPNPQLGTWQLEVHRTRLAQGPQQYVLVSNLVVTIP